MLPFRRRRARRRGFLIGRAMGRRAEREASRDRYDDDLSTELTRLADLRDRGVVSNDEFEREKQRLLDR